MDGSTDRRQFLRKLINIIHLLLEEPDFLPMKALEQDGYTPPPGAALTAQEEAVLTGKPAAAPPDDTDELVLVEDVW